MKRQKAAAAIFAVLLFAAGAAVGALAHRYYAMTVVSAHPSPEDMRQHYISEMRTRLRLTPGQVSQLEQIMSQTKAQYRALREASRPAMLKIKQDHVERVRSILNPEQIPEYERLVAEHERRSHANEH